MQKTFVHPQQTSCINEGYKHFGRSSTCLRQPFSMAVHLCGLHAHVAQGGLDILDVDAGLQKMDRITMAKDVRRYISRDCSLLPSALHLSRHR
jgi:hypothetical protein